MVAAGVAVAAGDIYNCGQMTGVYLDPADAFRAFLLSGGDRTTLAAPGVNFTVPCAHVPSPQL